MNIELIHELFYILFLPLRAIGFSPQHQNDNVGWYKSVTKKCEISLI